MKQFQSGSMGPLKGGIGGNHVLTPSDMSEKLIFNIFGARSGTDPGWSQ